MTIKRFISVRVLAVAVAAVTIWGCTPRRPPKVAPEAPPKTQPTTRPTSRPVVRAWTPGPLPLDEVNLIFFGDWGSDNTHQRYTAENLARYVASTNVQFNAILSLGDNLYTKLKNGVDDMEWQTLFEDMYDPKRLNMPFYVVLGNHDYEENKPAVQLEYAAKNPQSRWKFPAKWYRLELPENDPLVTVLMLDSDRFKLTRQEWARQIAWLEEELAKPRRSRWLVVAAHHPVFSNGLHGDNGLLQAEWGPLLEKHRVDFYASGHEHNMQHLEIPSWPTSFIVSGGGGRDKSLMRRERGPFSRSIYGFAHVKFTADRALVKIVNGKDGATVHQFERDIHGEVAVRHTTPSDAGKLHLKPQKPFDESDKVSPFVPTWDPEPPQKPEDDE